MTSESPDRDPNGPKHPLGMMTLATSLFLIATGFLGIGLYAVGAVRVVMTDAEDRSWLYWGLGVAAIGLTLVVGGVLLFVMWRKIEADTGRD